MPCAVLGLPSHVRSETFSFFQNLLHRSFVRSNNVAAHLDKYVSAFVRHLPAMHFHDKVAANLEANLEITSTTINRRTVKSLSKPQRREAGTSQRSQLYEDWFSVLDSSWTAHDAAGDLAKEAFAQTVWLSKVYAKLLRLDAFPVLHATVRSVEDMLIEVIDQDPRIFSREMAYKSCFLDALAALEPSDRSTDILISEIRRQPHFNTHVFHKSDDEDGLEIKRPGFIDILFRYWNTYALSKGLRADHKAENVSRRKILWMSITLGLFADKGL
ncbi:hypothetical protein OIV83_006208, partial [Microbotryomycetes sp. JL201]